MKLSRILRIMSLAVISIFMLVKCLLVAEAKPQSGAAPANGSDYIQGVVSSSKGPEAGVWVVAETTDLPTRFYKIVVTDDQGRYTLPQLPKANYNIFVRGYGLVDSARVSGKPSQHLDLKAVLAPDARAAAQVYPANYWLSMIDAPNTEGRDADLPVIRWETRQRGKFPVP